MKYYIVNGNVTAYEADGSQDKFIPKDAAPMTPEEVEAHLSPGPDPVPTVISRFQARAALMDAGLLADAELAIADADPLTQLAWAEATEWRRDSPTIAALADAIGLTADQVDDLFRTAAQITA